MKKITLTILAAASILLFMSANSNAGVHVGVYVGGPGYYYYPNNYPTPYYGDGYYTPHYGYGYYHTYRHHRYYHYRY